MFEEKIKELIYKMSLKEKAAFCSGEDFWFLKANQALGIPKVMVSDGPNGLRKQEAKADHLGIEKSVAAVCFPAGCLSAASFDPQVTEALGDSLGRECQHFDVAAILGPSVNIKRSPLGGRNFEYYSEDPLVAGKMATGFIKGVQKHHVGTSIKHFAANSQETRRMTSSSNVDERTLREIYLPAFEMAIKEAKPWTVMSSYNRINGEYVGDNQHFLTDLLRKEWGFDGMVMSDWGGVNNRVKSLKAGLDLEMPGTGQVTTDQLIEAVKTGDLKEEQLDQAVGRILEFILKYVSKHQSNAPLDLEHDHQTAQKIAEESIILLKNEDQVLPLSANKKVAFIGQYAKKPRYQGGGSSHINSFKVVSALDAAAQNGLTVDYAQGFVDNDQKDAEKLLLAAVKTAKNSQVAVIFAGLPDSLESEGYDRTKMQLPDYQNRLIEAVAQVQPNTIVVLHNGSPVEMPWVNQVKGIIETYLGGQAVGQAVINILTGKVNPSGKLAETFPIHLEDNPSYLFYGGEGDQVDYREGLFVGYRYYTSKKQPVLFPFGYGLSYTKFKYDNLCLDKQKITDQEELQVSLQVTNVGQVAGKEVVELYISPAKGKVIRPVLELKGFKKILLQPGETQTVTFKLNKRAFAYWETQLHDWHVETGDYTIKVGSSSVDLPLTQTVKVMATERIPVKFDLNSTMGDIFADPQAGPKLKAMMQQAAPSDVKQDDPDAAVSQEMMVAMMQSMPLRQLLSFVPGITYSQVQQMITVLNQA